MEMNGVAAVRTMRWPSSSIHKGESNPWIIVAIQIGTPFVAPSPVSKIATPSVSICRYASMSGHVCGSGAERAGRRRRTNSTITRLLRGRRG